MSKLTDLLRQRELVAQHLAWLDGEIASEQAGGEAQRPSSPSPASPTGTATPAVQSSPLTAPAAARPPLPLQPAAAPAEPKSPTAKQDHGLDAVSEGMIEQYQSQAANSPAEARRGCLVLFFSVTGVLAVILTAIWLIKYR